MGFPFKFKNLEEAKKVVHNYCVKVTKINTLTMANVSILQAFLSLLKKYARPVSDCFC